MPRGPIFPALSADGKALVYESGLKVPPAVVWPEHIAAGSTTDFACLLMNLLPTLFDAAGIQIPHPIEGRSLLPTLMGQRQDALRNVWFFARREGGLPYGGKTIEAVRRGPWKLLQNSPFAPLPLYHLENDPREQTNLAKDNPQIVNQLNALVRQHLQEGGRVPRQPPHGQVTDR